MNNTVKAKLSNPVYSLTWRAIASALSDSEKHILDKPTAPGAYAENLVGGNVSSTGTKYKITYCLIDPTTGNLLAESEPSDVSNSVSVTDGRVIVTFPKRTQKIANAYRIYRYTSSANIQLSPSVNYTVTSSTDDATNATYYVPVSTTTITPTRVTSVRFVNDNSHPDQVIRSENTAHIGTDQSTGSGNFSIPLLIFSTSTLPQILQITNVSFQFTISSSSATNMPVDINLAGNLGQDLNPNLDEIPTSASSSGYQNQYVIDATSGGKKYVTGTNSFWGNILNGSVTLGTTGSVIATDLATLKQQGKNLTLGLVSQQYQNRSQNKSSTITNSKIVVTSGSTPLNYSTSSSYLHMGHGLDNTKKSSTGLRFRGIQIPNGSTILSAYIKFVAFPDYLNTNTGCKLSIYGEAADNASSFGNEADYNGRTLTTANTSWDSTTTPALTTWVAESTYQTPSLTSIVQEIVNRGGWTAGNTMNFRIKDNGSSSAGVRSCYSFDGSSGKAPILYITYKSSSTVATYKYVDQVTGMHTKFYADNFSDSDLISNTSLPASASSDLILSNLQTVMDPVNPYSSEQARITITAKSTYKTPEDRILFITHLSNGDASPVTLGATSPISFKIWRSDAARGYSLLTNPIPVPPGSILSVTSGSSDIYIIGYLVPISSSSNYEVFWKSVTNTSTYSVDFKGFLLGGYNDSTGSTTRLSVLRDGTSSSIFYSDSNGRFNDPNKGSSGGGAALADPTIPVMIKEGDIIQSTSTDIIYVWGIKAKNL